MIISPLSSSLVFHPSDTVDQLLNPNFRAWDCDLVCTTFPSLVAEQILSLPLLHQDVEDRIVWKDTKNGYYTTKSS